MGEKNPRSLIFESHQSYSFLSLIFSVLFTFLLLTPQHDLSAVPGSVFAARKRTHQKQLVHPACKKADPFLHAVLMLSCALFAHCR